MSAEKEKLLRQFLPQVDDPRIQELLDDPRVMFYTDAEVPPAYQDWDGALQGVHSVRYNISADPNEPFGNGNIKFPWGGPAGTHRSPNVSSFRFMWLPLDDQDKPRPVVWFRKVMRGDKTSGYAWRFPVGTVFGEVLMMRSPAGADYTYELRVRIRERDHWDVDVFRPFPRPRDLVARIQDLRPDWQRNDDLARLVRHLETPIVMTTHTLRDRQPGQRVFHQQAGVDVLPPVGDDRLVAELLTTTEFKSVLGTFWRRDENLVEAFAPTTHAEFHIVPPNYDAGFVEVDRDSCLRCHESVANSVRRFDFARDWYGRVRGSDGIFTFHPFARDSISSSGYKHAVRMRSDLVEAGFLEKFDSRRHPATHYTQIVELKE